MTLQTVIVAKHHVVHSYFQKFWWWFWRPEDHLNCCLFEALCKVSFRFFLNAAILIWFQLLPGQSCKNSRKSNWPVYYIWSIRVNAWKLRESAKLRISPKEGTVPSQHRHTRLTWSRSQSFTNWHHNLCTRNACAGEIMDPWRWGQVPTGQEEVCTSPCAKIDVTSDQSQKCIQGSKQSYTCLIFFGIQHLPCLMLHV